MAGEPDELVTITQSWWGAHWCEPRLAVQFWVGLLARRCAAERVMPHAVTGTAEWSDPHRAYRVTIKVTGLRWPVDCAADPNPILKQLVGAFADDLREPDRGVQP